MRYIANRSSGRVGTLLAREAARRGHAVTLLLGPVPVAPPPEGVVVRRFRTCEDLRTLLSAHAHEAHVIVMAAAVADFRPAGDRSSSGKVKRRPGESLTLELEPTPDLIAEVAGRRRPGQFIVAFALETAGEVLASARTKLDRKRVDLVVGNPLETMDAQTIEAVVVDHSGIAGQTPGVIGKEAFAAWLLDLIESRSAGQTP